MGAATLEEQAWRTSRAPILATLGLAIIGLEKIGEVFGLLEMPGDRPRPQYPAKLPDCPPGKHEIIWGRNCGECTKCRHLFLTQEE